MEKDVKCAKCGSRTFTITDNHRELVRGTLVNDEALPFEVTLKTTTVKCSKCRALAWLEERATLT